MACATSAGTRSVKGAARPPAGVVDDDIGRADLALDQAEQPLDLLGLGRIAGKGVGAGLGAERAELFDLARGERDLDAFAREQPRQRCAQAFAGADDQGGLVFRHFHARAPEGRDLVSRRAILPGNPRARGDRLKVAPVGRIAQNPLERNVLVAEISRRR